MRRKNYTAIKLLFLLAFLLFVAVCIAGKVRKSYDETTYSGKKIGIAEVKQELSFGIYAQQDWDTYFENYGQKYLTGEMLSGILDTLGVAEYIESPKTAGRSAVSRENWNQVYEQILELLDMEQSVQAKTLLVLDVMEMEEKRVLITNEGDFYTALPATFFEDWNGYRLYCVGEDCLGIAEVSGEELVVANAYLKQSTTEQVSFLYGGASYEKEIGGAEEPLSTGVCDIIFSNGSIISLRLKQDVITGDLLSYDDTQIEIGGYGKIAHSGRIPVYQTYGESVEKSISDVVLGNMEVEYVTGGQEVCAILIKQPADITDIRILLLAKDGTKFRGSVYLTCNVSAVLTCGEWEETVAAKSVIPASEFLTANPGSTLVLRPESESGVISVCDADGNADGNGYGGKMEVRSYEEGFTLVNELPFEQYLYAVVPSEMPSSYAIEAQKAQAVCARSYAYIQLLRADLAEYGAHINDSTSYQVYNNIPATAESISAVDATAGQMLTYQGNPVEAYYFSTSMGYTDTAAVWNAKDDTAYGYLKSAFLCTGEGAQQTNLSDEAAFLAFIGGMPAAYDGDIKYYRWFATADYREKTDEINAILQSREAAAPGNITFYKEDRKTELSDDASLTTLGKITALSTDERSSAGSLLALRITYEHGSALVKTEYNIRKVLGAGVSKIVYADSSESTSVSMLPSAFCAIVPQGDGTVTLQGGGYGHGLGMSQNAANGMAKAGMSYEDILHYFYNDVTLETIGG